MIVHSCCHVLYNYRKQHSPHPSHHCATCIPIDIEKRSQKLRGDSIDPDVFQVRPCWFWLALEWHAFCLVLHISIESSNHSTPKMTTNHSGMRYPSHPIATYITDHPHPITPNNQPFPVLEQTETRVFLSCKFYFFFSETVYCSL
jgi:hypothetical protein